MKELGGSESSREVVVRGTDLTLRSALAAQCTEELRVLLQVNTARRLRLLRRHAAGCARRILLRALLRAPRHPRRLCAPARLKGHHSAAGSSLIGGRSGRCASDGRGATHPRPRDAHMRRGIAVSRLLSRCALLIAPATAPCEPTAAVAPPHRMHSHVLRMLNGTTPSPRRFPASRRAPIASAHSFCPHAALIGHITLSRWHFLFIKLSFESSALVCGHPLHLRCSPLLTAPLPQR